MYTIHILPNKDFDNLGHFETKGAQVNDSLGFANRDTGKAYVRHTAVDELNKYLIDHEFDELVQSESAHEDEFGIRHKKFRETIGNIAQPAGYVASAATGNPLFAAGGSALKGGIGGQKPSFGGAVQGGVQGGLTSFLGNSLLNGLFSGGSPAPMAEGVRKGFTSASGVGRALMPGTSATQTIANPASQATGGGLSGFFKNLFRGSQGSSGAGGTMDTGQKSGGSLMDMFGGKTALGVGSLAAGLLSPLPKAPDISGITGELRNQLNSNRNSQANSVISGNLNKTFNPLSSQEIDASLRQYRQTRKLQRDQILDLYRNVRPGSDPTTDTSMERDLNQFDQESATGESDIIGNKTRGAEQSFNQNQMQNIQAQLGANEQEMNQLRQISQLDIDQIMSQLHIDYAQAALFKETFTGIGQDIISSSLNLFQPQE